MFPFSSSTSTSTEDYESRLKTAERKLLDFARRYSTTIPVDNADTESEASPETPLETFDAFDTYIPRSAVRCLTPAKNKEDGTLRIHCVRATRNVQMGNLDDQRCKLPLVNLHGYMNAGAYFYRNLGGLCAHFPSIYAVDMLGWGLSSRPSWEEVKENDTIESAEDFFVESLEAWRLMNDIDKMVLSGHSFGAYVAVTYCERYPEHVDRLVLLSPFGVPDPQDPNIRDKLERFQSSLRGQLFVGVFSTMFDRTTPGAVIRSFTEYRGTLLARNYVERRLPEIDDDDESKTLADFLYLNAILPPSGEFFLRSLFHNSMLAKRPLLFRIPSLGVRSVSFMYGTTDWMDLSGGMYTEALCHRLSQQADGSASTPVPDVDVFLVPSAGHLLILQNPKAVNTCMVGIAGGDIGGEEMPSRMAISETAELNESCFVRAREIRERNKRVGS